MNAASFISARPPKFGLIATAGVAACLAWSSPGSALDISFRDFPYVIYCESGGIAHAFYFSRLGADGVATYLTPDRQAGIITIDGVGKRVGGDQSGTCANKTLDDLRSSLQAYDLPR